MLQKYRSCFNMGDPRGNLEDNEVNKQLKKSKSDY